ncbi:MAG: hypothetical protein L6R41_004126 [Letrouitia leprolyta]|nr:MAG: hypothetical protein L6R41_004126 [Letrouitia leprolyta]
MNDDWDDPPLGHIETMVDDYVYLDTTERTAPNGKPASVDPPPAKPLPGKWELKRTPEGDIYYVNHTTQTTHWTCEEILTTDNFFKDSEVKPLPEGWEQRLDENQNPYYVDHNTRSTTWVRPDPSNKDTFRRLPSGWERRYTEDGRRRLYYVNHNDKTTSWNFPEHLLKDSNEATGTSTSMSLNEAEQRLKSKI